MSKQIEALKLALVALERSVATCFDQYAHQQVMSQPDHFINQTITAIKEALANVATEDTSKERVDEIQKQRHEQEPVGYVIVKNHGKVNILDFDFDFDVAEQLSEGKYPAYITPPQRTWQGLTEDEINEVLGGDIRDEPSGELEFVRAIEAKLKEKNT